MMKNFQESMCDLNYRRFMQYVLVTVSSFRASSSPTPIGFNLSPVMMGTTSPVENCANSSVRPAITDIFPCVESDDCCKHIRCPTILRSFLNLSIVVNRDTIVDDELLRGHLPYRA